MATYEETAKTTREAVDDSLEIVKKALSEKDFDAYNAGLADLEKNVKTHNAALCAVEYERLAHEPHPMIAAVKAFYVDTCRIKEEKDKETGAITGIAIESSKKRIDLEKFCDHANLNKGWINDTAELLALLTLREIDVFAMPASELAKQSMYFIHAARKKKEGETPDSNTQVVSLLQKIIDGTIFVDNGEGKNAYKCNNHDIAFIHDAVTKLDTKGKCSIAMLNQRQFQTVMMSVLAHCLGEQYTVKTAKSKQSA